MSSLLVNRKESDSLLGNTNHWRDKETFKLKSTVVKQREEYESPHEKSDFSLLEENREKIGNRYGMGGRKIINGRLIIDRADRKGNLGLQGNRKIAAHLFSKYAQVGEDYKSKIKLLKTE